MSTSHDPAPSPIALQPGKGEALWFMDFLATIKATAEETGGRVAVIHHAGPKDSGSPLHVHHRENEWFWVLDGELTIWVGGQVIQAPAGSFVFGPQHTPHTFTVSSPGGARFLLVTEPAGFEGFMRSCAQPARSLTLPPPPSAPPDPGQLTAIAAEYGIDILGPPGIPS
jgi:quercetin dioxygenase-like cupin family protein